MTQTFRISFGSQYATRPHPVLQGAHPDTYLTVTCPDSFGDEELRVRQALHDWIGSAWSMIYGQDHWQGLVEDGGIDRYWPRGELRAMTVVEVVAEGILQKAVDAAKPQALTLMQMRDHLNTMLNRGVAGDTPMQRWDNVLHDWVPVTTVAGSAEYSGLGYCRVR